MTAHDAPTASRQEPIVRAKRPVPRARLRDLLARTALRGGVPPLLVCSDVLTIALAASVLTVGSGSALAFAVAFVAAGSMQRLYLSRLSPSALDDAMGVVATAGIAAALLAIGRSFGSEVALTSADIRLTAVSVLGVLVTRAMLYAVVRWGRRRRLVSHRALIVGAGRVGEHLARALRNDRSYGLEPVGFLDSDPLLTAEERTLAVLGGPEDLAEVVTRLGVREVVIAFALRREQDVVDIVRVCDRLDCEVFFVPRLFDLHGRAPAFDEVDGIPLVRLPRAAHRTRAWRVKRLVDVVVTLVAGVVLSPVLLVCAAAVRIDGGPGVLFRQERIGADGKRFTLLKFRTLRPSDEAESATRWSIAGDDRVTPVGRILRSTSLDELPQLWNVLRGDMTLVGPRPERPHFVEQFSEQVRTYALRHRVPAGLTGWSQVRGLRGATSIEERARFDNAYIDNWSLALDAKILLRTVKSVVRRSGS